MLVMTEWERPASSAWSERAVLGWAILSPDDAKGLLELCPPVMLYVPGHATVAALIAAMVAEQVPVDPSTLAARLDLSGQSLPSGSNAGSYLAELVKHAAAGLEQATYHASLIRETYAERQLQVGLRQAADGMDGTGDLIDSASAHALSAIETAQGIRAGSRPATVRTAADLLAVDPPMVWRVPDLISEREKIVFTGYEGVGKSELQGQIAVCAAAGTQPFTGEEHEPQRVLLVDLENELGALRRRYRRLVGAVELIHDFDRELLMVESIEAGMDILRPEHWVRLRRLVDAARPDLLMIGPLYKLAVGQNLNHEEVAVEITAKLDTLRVEHNLAVMTEAHMSKEKSGDGKRAPAPRGSSVFLGWPSIGFGLRPHSVCGDVPDGERPGVLELKQFRGNRELRAWPTAIEAHQGWAGHPVLPFQAWYERGLAVAR